MLEKQHSISTHSQWLQALITVFWRGGSPPCQNTLAQQWVRGRYTNIAFVSTAMRQDFFRSARCMYQALPKGASTAHVFVLANKHERNCLGLVY